MARWILSLRERREVVNARALRPKARPAGLREAEKVKLALATLVEADWLRPLSQTGERSRHRDDYLVHQKW